MIVSQCRANMIYEYAVVGAWVLEGLDLDKVGSIWEREIESAKPALCMIRNEQKAMAENTLG